MQLYFAPKTISIVAVIALEEARLDHELVKVDFAAAEQSSPAYGAINPKGRVPALVTDNGILTETGAILEYIADLAPDAELVPPAPYKAAKMREMMFYLASTMHVNHAHKMRGHRWADEQTSWDDMAAKVPETMAQSCSYIEQNTLGGPYVLGDSFSLADPYLYVVATWLKGDGVDTAAYPKLSAFIETMEKRSSVRAVLERGFL